jgi:receptor-binding and translocation channel-forming TcA subunit of Tc toxin
MLFPQLEYRIQLYKLQGLPGVRQLFRIYRDIRFLRASFGNPRDQTRFDFYSSIPQRIAEEIGQLEQLKLAQVLQDNTARQIEQSQEVAEFLRTKFTGEELYSWMQGEISTIYFQCYQMTYDLAKKAERCFRFERGLTSSIRSGP